MTPPLCALMAEYNRWMNDRLYDAAATLPDAQLFQDRGAFFGSLFDTLNHIAAADLIWLHRFARHTGLAFLAQAMPAWPDPTSLTQRVAGTLPELRALRSGVDELIVRLASQASEQLLGSSIRYTSMAGQAQCKNLGLVLLHFFNHQTHHRGQASALLFQAGVDVGVTDLAALVPSEI